MLSSHPPDSNPQRPIRLLLVDDHPVTLLGLQHLVQDERDMEIVAACGTREEAMEVARSKPLDLVLFDLYLHGIREWRTVDWMLEEQPRVRVIVFSGISEEEEGLEALKRDRCGYLEKGLAPELLIDFIRLAMDGHIAASRNLLEHLARFRRGEVAVHGSLSDMERTVLNALGERLTVNQIAIQLSRSENTIYEYTRRIRYKLKLKSLRELEYLAWTLQR